MYKINEIVQQTGLNERYVRQCVRELKDIFSVKRGVKNSILLDHSALPVFEKIKQEKENGVSFSAIKELLLNTTECKTESKLGGSYDEWIGVKTAVKLTGKSETTIRRLVIKFKGDHTRLKKDESSQRDKWLLSKRFVLKHFNNHSSHHEHDPGDNHGVIHDHNQNSIQDNIHKPIQSTGNNEQVIELLEKQIEVLQNQVDDFKIQTTELKEQLNKKDDQLNKRVEQFENLLNQKDQQIHQLHVLLKESKISTIDYKPDENLGVFSKVLVRFGL